MGGAGNRGGCAHRVWYHSLTIVLLFRVRTRYVSPFYSPPVGRPDWLPWFITAPMFILWIPLGFRATCYYYRKAYHRAFFTRRRSARVQEKEPRSPENYRGERAASSSTTFTGTFCMPRSWSSLFSGTTRCSPSSLRGRSRSGGGSLPWLLNVVLISAYTFSCHSMRHLVGGNKDCYTCVRGATRGACFTTVSPVST